jgi:hypothetical protein
MDNLSIQWSFENVPLPDSPWLLPMANANAPNESLMESGSSVFWLTDAQKAWKLASIQKRPHPGAVLRSAHPNLRQPQEYHSER